MQRQTFKHIGVPSREVYSSHWLQYIALYVSGCRVKQFSEQKTKNICYALVL